MLAVLRTYSTFDGAEIKASDCEPEIFPLSTTIRSMLDQNSADGGPYCFYLGEIDEKDVCRGLSAASRGDLHQNWKAGNKGVILLGEYERETEDPDPGHVIVILATCAKTDGSEFCSDQDPEALIFPLSYTVQNLLDQRAMMTEHEVLVHFFVASIDEAHLCEGLTAASTGNVHSKWKVEIRTPLLPLS